MELNITRIFRELGDPARYSASVAEMGPDAGRITWARSVDRAQQLQPLSSAAEIEAWRRLVVSSGGWTRDEVDASAESELQALCLQWIAAEMRECNIGPDSTDDDWLEYERLSSEGQVSSRICRGDGGLVFFDIGD